jgi:putative membrane protein
MRLLIRLAINAAALWAATRLVSGITFDGEPAFLLVVALVFGILNALVRPIMMILTLPLIIVTIGLFILVLNAFMLYLTGMISDRFDLGFHVADFWSAFLGSLVVSIVSFVLSVFVGSTKVKRVRRET